MARHGVRGRWAIVTLRGPRKSSKRLIEAACPSRASRCGCTLHSTVLISQPAPCAHCNQQNQLPLAVPVKHGGWCMTCSMPSARCMCCATSGCIQPLLYRSRVGCCGLRRQMRARRSTCGTLCRSGQCVGAHRWCLQTSALLRHS